MSQRLTGRKRPFPNWTSPYPNPVRRRSNGYRPRFFGVRTSRFAYRARRGRLIGKFPDRRIIDETVYVGSGISNNETYNTYVMMPSLGQGPHERNGRKIKLHTMHLRGAISVIPPATAHNLGSEEMDQAEEMPTMAYAGGIAVIILVQDKEPSTQGLPQFSDVFTLGDSPGSLMNCMVRSDMTYRFNVIMRETVVENGSSWDSKIPVAQYMKLNEGRGIICSFRDNEGKKEGNYLNVRENALMLYVIYDSNHPSSIGFNMNMRMVYYH
ncbi:hypothetical protein OROGR_002300 [Orobanche gracilis]